MLLYQCRAHGVIHPWIKFLSSWPHSFGLYRNKQMSWSLWFLDCCLVAEWTHISIFTFFFLILFFLCVDKLHNKGRYFFPHPPLGGDTPKKKKTSLDFNWINTKLILKPHWSQVSLHNHGTGSETLHSLAWLMMWDDVTVRSP